MLFRKDIPKSCTYCLYSERKNSTKYHCSKKGTVNEDDSCFFFRYDPCKRIPIKAKALNFDQYTEEDFTL